MSISVIYDSFGEESIYSNCILLHNDIKFSAEEGDFNYFLCGINWHIYYPDHSATFPNQS